MPCPSVKATMSSFKVARSSGSAMFNQALYAYWLSAVSHQPSGKVIAVFEFLCLNPRQIGCASMKLQLAGIAGMGVLVLVLSLFSATGACSCLENNLFSSGEEIQFKVPEDVIALQEPELKASSEEITVCNHGVKRWSNLHVQISTVGAIYEESLPPHAPAYTAQTDHLDGGKCKGIPIGDFV